MSLKDILTQSNDRLRAIKPKVEELAKATENIKEVTATPYSLSKGSVACDSEGLIEGVSPFVHKTALTYNVEFPSSGDVMLSASGCEAKKLRLGVVMGDWTTSSGTSSSVVVAYGNGRFVRMTSSASTSHSYAYYSDDGITWTLAKLPASAKWYSIAYGEVNGVGRFVATAINSNSAAYSDDDGVSWTLATLPDSVTHRNLIYGNGKFILFGLSYDRIHYSDDGITWNDVDDVVSDEYAWNGCCAAYGEVNGKGRFVFLSTDSTTGAVGRGCYSDDGIEWTEYDLPDFGMTPSTSQYIAYGNGRFVANVVGATGNMYSDDGINWVYASHPYRIYDVTFGSVDGHGVFVARHDNYTTCVCSEDGINWVKSFLPYNGDIWKGISYGGGRFITFCSSASKQAHCDPKIELMLS